MCTAEIKPGNEVSVPRPLVLHNNAWMVFDASPNYLFQYSDSEGIVGIYIGPTASYDFRILLHERNFQLSSLDAMEYRITGSAAVAACSK